MKVFIKSFVHKVLNLMIGILLALVLLTLSVFHGLGNESEKALQVFLDRCNAEMTEIELIEAYRNYSHNHFHDLKMIPLEDGVAVETSKRTVTGHFHRLSFQFDADSGMAVQISRMHKLCSR